MALGWRATAAPSRGSLGPSAFDGCDPPRCQRLASRTIALRIDEKLSGAGDQRGFRRLALGLQALRILCNAESGVMPPARRSTGPHGCRAHPVCVCASPGSDVVDLWCKARERGDPPAVWQPSLGSSPASVGGPQGRCPSGGRQLRPGMRPTIPADEGGCLAVEGRRCAPTRARAIVSISSAIPSGPAPWRRTFSALRISTGLRRRPRQTGRRGAGRAACRSRRGRRWHGRTRGFGQRIAPREGDPPRGEPRHQPRVASAGGLGTARASGTSVSSHAQTASALFSLRALRASAKTSASRQARERRSRWWCAGWVGAPRHFVRDRQSPATAQG